MTSGPGRSSTCSRLCNRPRVGVEPISGAAEYCVVGPVCPTAAWPGSHPFATLAAMQLVPRDFFLERYGLAADRVARVLDAAVAKGADHADCFLEFRIAQTASL